MHNSSKSLPAGRQGEIALTLTLISLGLMLIGTMLGGLQTSQTLRGNAASCEYNTVGSVWYQKNGDEHSYALTKALNGNRHMYVTNNAGQRGEIDDTFGQYGYHPDNFPAITPYYDSVTLNNLDDTQWVVKKISCDPINGNPPGKGCPFNGERDGGKTIPNFLVTCGENASYGWLVEHPSTPAGLSPTPLASGAPTTAPPGSRPACSYKTHALVLGYDPANPGSTYPLTLYDNGAKSTSYNFGVSNNRQSQYIPAGQFGKQNINGKISSFSTFIEYKYSTDTQAELFSPADVTLIGLNTNIWRIRSTFCTGAPDCTKGLDCAKGCPANVNQGSNAVYRNFTPDCGVDIDYGWVVEPAPTSAPIKAPTPRPTKFSDITPTEAPPTPLPTRVASIPPALPTPQPTNASNPTCEQNAQGHCDIPASEDSFVDSNRTHNWRNETHGKMSYITVGYLDDNANGKRDFYVRDSFLQFDLTNLKNKKIKKAQLSLVRSNCTSYGPGVTPRPQSNTIGVFSNKSLWQEDAITWNNMPQYDPIKVGGFVIPSDTCDGLQNYPTYTVDLKTSLVQEWTDRPEKNFGIMLKNMDSTSGQALNLYGNQTEFYSKDQANASIAPRLVIDFEGAQMNPLPAKSPLARKDFNGDGRINIVDLFSLLNKLGTKGENMKEDLNNDGVVNMIDAAAEIVSLGKSTK